MSAIQPYVLPDEVVEVVAITRDYLVRLREAGPHEPTLDGILARLELLLLKHVYQGESRR